MALNRIFREDPRKNRARVAPAGTTSGSPRVIDDRPAVALTDRGDATKSFTIEGSDITVSGLPSGGVGLAPDQASFAFDGTWEFAVAGATTTTGQGVAVYITTGNTLTLTEGTNTLFGHTDYPVGYFKRAGFAPVRIGE